MKSDMRTWVEHALICVGASSLVGLVSGLGAAAFASVMWALYFTFVREALDEKLHKLDGDWDTPSASGVTPRIDQWGDLIGPWTAAVTFVISWGLARGV